MAQLVGHLCVDYDDEVRQSCARFRRKQQPESVVAQRAIRPRETRAERTRPRCLTEPALIMSSIVHPAVDSAHLSQ